MKITAIGLLISLGLGLGCQGSSRTTTTPPQPIIPNSPPIVPERPQMSAMVRGGVSFKDGQPAVNARVILTDKTSQVSSETQTDASGKFSFSRELKLGTSFKLEAIAELTQIGKLLRSEFEGFIQNPTEVSLILDPGTLNKFTKEVKLTSTASAKNFSHIVLTHKENAVGEWALKPAGIGISVRPNQAPPVIQGFEIWLSAFNGSIQDGQIFISIDGKQPLPLKKLSHTRPALSSWVPYGMNPLDLKQLNLTSLSTIKLTVRQNNPATFGLAWIGIKIGAHWIHVFGTPSNGKLTVESSTEVREVAGLNPHRSIAPRENLIITDVGLVSQISLKDVLETLVRQNGNASLTPSGLWKQLWERESLCNQPPLKKGTLNGFPIDCPRPEAAEAALNPFDPSADTFYKTIALVNRFDLAAADGSHCGQARIVFARSSGEINDQLRNLVIFEAQMPNPNPSCGVSGCQEYVNFWNDLSAETNPVEKAKALRKFYLSNSPTGPAVIDLDHFSFNSGQIRTNQFLSAGNGVPWQLREFRLVQQCPTPQTCTLEFVPDTVKNNPFGELFSDSSTDARRASFQDFVSKNIRALDTPVFDEMPFEVPNEFNAGQSNSQGQENLYSLKLQQSTSFKQSIITSGRTQSSNLQPEHIVRRFMAQSCAGCHELNNSAQESDLGNDLTWPSSLGFVHISEKNQETIDGRPHFEISPALKASFLPHRKQVIENYLRSTVECPVHPASAQEKNDDSPKNTPPKAQTPEKLKRTIGGGFANH